RDPRPGGRGRHPRHALVPQPPADPGSRVRGGSPGRGPRAGALIGSTPRSIFLIRHGETVGNAARIVQLPEAALSPRGVAQAERLARRLASMGIAGILASDLPRALTTAEALRRTTGAPLEIDPLLQERNFGDVRGTPYARLDFDLFAPHYAPPAGESWEVF